MAALHTQPMSGSYPLRMFAITMISSCLGAVEIGTLMYLYSTPPMDELFFTLLSISSTFYIVSAFLAFSNVTLRVMSQDREYGYIASTAEISCALGFISTFLISLVIVESIPLIISYSVLYLVCLLVVIVETIKLHC